jgi:hypothetical protein
MPIQKFLNTPITTGTGLERIAKLHKGTPKQKKMKGDREIEVVGRDTDYFRVEFVDGYEYLSADFAQLYGPQPKEIPFMLDADTALEALDFWYEDYDSKGTMLHRCDGVNQPVCYNATTGYHEHNQPCIIGKCSCKQVARLALALPDFIAATGILGTVTMETHSDQDIRTLIARLTTFANMFGTLRGVPLILVRVKKDTSAPKTTRDGVRTGERTKIPRAMIDVRVEPEFARQKLMGALTGQFRTERALPHAVVVADENAPLALGSGARRIEAPALPATPDPTPTPIPGSHWTSDEASWKGFTDWAAMYGCSALDVLDALEETAEAPIEGPADWTGDKTRAMGAIIARVCDYNLEKIAKWRIKGLKESLSDKTQASIRADAKQIAEARHASLMSNVGPDDGLPAPDPDAAAFAAKDAFDDFPA